LPEGEAVEELRRTVGERMANEATSAYPRASVAMQSINEVVRGDQPR
jgi:hypothetical protein